ncbi:hypothetical protein HPB50_007895 [Hyalomma asiaticum]|uniref:Uncharacterized protein n=1 Tax=Hyalomma asiaticum TaxID=266040 RepID=A0ACB7RW29_HYAAI|nr:hypothetical protein HPB50_007895 [Hyalomma asiaticum]
MPTCAELAKRLEKVEALSESKLDEVAERLLVKFQEKIRSVEPDVVALKAELESLISSVTMLNSVIETIKSEYSTFASAYKDLMRKNEILSKKVAEMEQYSRANNVELKGVPYSQGEDCSAIIRTIASKVDCPISDSDIDIVHRVPTRAGSAKNIIARFCSRAKKQEFVNKARKARLTSRDLGFSGAHSNAVFINDHLTPENKRLFAKAL